MSLALSWSRLLLADTFSSRLRRYQGLPVLRSLPPVHALLILYHIGSWLRHLRQHQRRWTPRTLPSVPLLSSGAPLVMWNTVSPQLLHAPPPDLCWHYHAGSDHQTLTLVPISADPVPTAVLWAPTCPVCGRPQPLTGHLLLGSTPVFSSAAGACCWSTPAGQPLTASAAARASVALGVDVLRGVLPISTLRRHSCEPPRTPPPLPPYDTSQLAPRPRKGAGRLPPHPLSP